MNWGIIGYGSFAPKFLASLVHVPGQKIAAIASRSNFKQIRIDHPNAKAYEDYKELLDDPEIEVVYVSTTHNFHLQNTLDAFKAGKHVLCEKPLGVNLQEYEKMIEAAESSRRFFMEALWLRFLPAYREAMGLLRSGLIGVPEWVSADFGFKSDAPDNGRLFNPALAGGSVLDVGIYPISFALDVFRDSPISVSSRIRPYPTGVDASASMLLDFGDGRHANLFSSVVTDSIHEGVICGSKGTIRMKGFWHAEHIETIIDGEVQIQHLPFRHTGYYHEIEEVVSCISRGQTQSEIVPWSDSLKIAEVMEEVLSHH